MSNTARPSPVAECDPVSDPSLSLAAKGLYMVLSTWSPADMMTMEKVTRRSRNGEVATRNAFNELVQAGYVRRLVSRTADGHFQAFTEVRGPGDPPFTDDPTPAAR